MFKEGLYTASITPFLDSEIDFKSFERLIEFQISSGVTGIVILGTTGEASCVTLAERKRVTDIAVSACGDEIEVILGCSSNCTKEAAELAMLAQSAGAGGALIVAPYYNKPSQDGIYKHYEYIAGSVDIPIIIYNNPSRTVVDIKDETIAKLARIDNIVALKDSSGDISRQSSLEALMDSDASIVQLCGDDMNVIPFHSYFGRGWISVSSNVFPKECSDIQDLLLRGNIKEAAHIQMDFIKFYKDIFSEPSPAGIKYAAYLMDLITSYEVRLPLTSASKDLQRKILKFLNDRGHAS
ncbi:4-hydroxy-tetrahydrodipicolinate synthase [Candidatus Cyrtobacter comes]|uniref:4-hydroxy-tetrahydrodipicolinate synthase n=1 Tax=Candidatus Cyrtobacter comes TaxID=675776 RepID=A0ABU5L7F4_9RICK|nr:4-hydroxy-tetrahydrodipicolinate synthase [Candidatus Cyrtobacter comes]MDZ5762056.1 4-hydroxy-tetrahydrodipicolinate synthase [Candidatus Cyrtobacter comes]